MSAFLAQRTSRLYTPLAAARKGNSKLQFEPRDQFERARRSWQQIQALGFEAFSARISLEPHGIRPCSGVCVGAGARVGSREKEVRVAGRILSYRLMGKAGFAHLQGAGKRIQIYVKKRCGGRAGISTFSAAGFG